MYTKRDREIRRGLSENSIDKQLEERESRHSGSLPGSACF